MADEKISAQGVAPPKSPARAIVGFAAISGLLGLVFRLDGLGDSLWLDEFGTLWAVEGGLGTVIERVYEFHAQTPFYYLLPWLAVQLFGESEIALRLPSVIFGFGTLSIVYLLGRDGWGKEAGLLAASLLSVSYFAVEADASARPYALVLFFVALMLLGFTRAVLTGSRWGRVLFIAGCSGIFAGSYVMTPMIAGVGGAYLLFRDLRVKYPISQFMLDAGVAFITVTPWLPHLWALWGRRDGLAWITEVNSTFAMRLLAPFLFAIVIGSVRAFRGDQPRVIGALTATLWAAIIGQFGVMMVLALAGTNVLSPRYAIGILIPAVVLAAMGLRAYRIGGVICLLWCVLLNGWLFYGRYQFSGTFSRTTRDDWRQAVAHLDGLLEGSRDTPVLFRSGYIEQDSVTEGRVPDAALVTLRSPGTRKPEWNIVFLTHHWDAPRREEYFERTVAAAVRDASVFYYLSCAYCYNETTGQYPFNLIEWVEGRFSGQFRVGILEAGRGMLLLRFERTLEFQPNEPDSG